MSETPAAAAPVTAAELEAAHLAYMRSNMTNGDLWHPVTAALYAAYRAVAARYNAQAAAA